MISGKFNQCWTILTKHIQMTVEQNTCEQTAEPMLWLTVKMSHVYYTRFIVSKVPLRGIVLENLRWDARSLMYMIPEFVPELKI